ncbi:MAG: hypothetical protein DBX55_01890 [Verrucomicrobia bacterium]|nr:MAG: hypothetical protein DBX55_01890 [Verrucomicrobiota bacterium]
MRNKKTSLWRTDRLSAAIAFSFPPKDDARQKPRDTQLPQRAFESAVRTVQLQRQNRPVAPGKARKFFTIQSGRN